MFSNISCMISVHFYLFLCGCYQSLLGLISAFCFSINSRPLIQSSECKAYYVVLKFLNHLFNSFGGTNWLFFIPEEEDRLRFGGALEKAKLPPVEGLPILKLVACLHICKILQNICLNSANRPYYYTSWWLPIKPVF